jgi:hypothetical protein
MKDELLMFLIGAVGIGFLLAVDVRIVLGLFMYQVADLWFEVNKGKLLTKDA